MRNNEHGFSLMEILVALAIVAFLLSLMFLPQLGLQKTILQGQKKSEAVLKLNNIKTKILLTSDSLTSSSLVLPENDRLCPCTQGGNFKVNGNPVCTLTSCTSNVESGFSFYDPNPNTPGKLTGPPTNPVYYNMDGQLCSQLQDPETNCGYKMMTSFRAHCPGNFASCDHADYLVLILDIQPTAAFASEMAPEKTYYTYTVPLNYPPQIATVPAQTLTHPETRKIAITADPGDPTEVQNFIFEKCESSNPSVATVRCYKFVNSVAQILVTSQSPGTTQIRLQINDTSPSNSLSDISTFNVTVTLP